MYAENFDVPTIRSGKGKKMYDKNQFVYALWLPFILMTQKQKPLTPHSI